jgi:ABC-type sugar transport system substrate-binding protein
VVSLAEVARAAGVSSATVSRVMSGASYPVRDETRQKVLAAAGELGFRPNMRARGLVTSRTSIIAVVVHDISEPYFGEIVRGVEEAAAERGYQVLISSSERDPDHELDVLALLLAYNVEGGGVGGGRPAPAPRGGGAAGGPPTPPGGTAPASAAVRAKPAASSVSRWTPAAPRCS